MSPSKPAAIAAPALLALGSNLGDRAGNLMRALALLDGDSLTRVTAASSLYATDPVGMAGDEPEFLNAAALVRTERDPGGLLDLCLRVEAELGRVRTGRWVSRTMDVDILLYGDRRCEGGRLVLPHPRMKERAFVLLPAAEISPDWILDGKPIAEWASGISASGVRRVDLPPWRPFAESGSSHVPPHRHRFGHSKHQGGRS